MTDRHGMISKVESKVEGPGPPRRPLPRGGEVGTSRRTTVMNRARPTPHPQGGPRVGDGGIRSVAVCLLLPRLVPLAASPASPRPSRLASRPRPSTTRRRRSTVDATAVFMLRCLVPPGCWPGRPERAREAEGAIRWGLVIRTHHQKRAAGSQRLSQRGGSGDQHSRRATVLHRARPHPHPQGGPRVSVRERGISP